MRRYLIPFALVAVGALAQDEGSDEVMPAVVALTVNDGSASSKEIVAAVSKVRGSFEEKPVLFLDLNVATPGGKHQGAMLFTSLGLQGVLKECSTAGGMLVLVDLEKGIVLAKLGAKDNLAAELERRLAKKPGGAGDDGGCDDGCGG